MNIKRLIFKFFLENLPKNKIFDKILCFIQFTFIHKRFPTSKKYFNDMLHKIKTSDQIDDPLLVFTSDKEYVKIFLSHIIKKEYIVPNLFVAHSFKEIENYKITSNCVIKPTHLASKCIFKKNQEQLTELDKERIRGWFFQNLYYGHRERNYLYLRPKVIIEPIIFNDDNLIDYKFFCYEGKPKIIMLDFDKFTNKSRVFYDENWNKIDVSLGKFKINDGFEKPKNLDEMLKLSKCISSYFNFTRVDLYTDGKEILVGELTHTHAGATQKFIPDGLASEKKFSKILFS
tara:strand:+ start:6102 stop:6965 length:864 start_codon:yes stop_codon:yes gene_type:complete